MREVFALVYTDVVDSTRLNVRYGDDAMAALWAEHDRHARALVRQWRGREVGRSDGFLLLFASAVDALDFAQAYHALLAGLCEPWQARVGVHVGVVTLRENTEDDRAQGATPFEVDGVALPTAARILSVARGGQTLLSHAAVQALQGAQRPCRSIGHWQFKGLPEPVELYAVVAEGAPAAPPEDSAKGYRVVRGAGGWKPAREVAHSLPAVRDSFVGREDALNRLAGHFEQGARLVTLAGPGGIGKTRLAQQHARAWLGALPGGAWFCDLSSARDLDGVVNAVAQGLNVPLGRADPVQQLGAAISGRGECLVVLDNLEQVVAHAPATLGCWLDAAPEARFLVTSREVLGLPGETVQWLQPLEPHDAVAMFRQRVAAAGVERGFDACDEASLAPLMDLLDRLPLAIELAAARARLMPPRMLLERMRDRFDLLAARSGRVDRQATMRATLDWSWALLTPIEQSALAQLSVFEGGFDLAAAEAVVDLSGFRFPPEVVNVVQALVEKSLVRLAGAGRFGLLVAVQEYAAERRRAFDGTANPVTGALDRHAAHYAGLQARAGAAGLCADLDNLVAATRRAAASGRSDSAVGALQGAWAALKLRGPFRVGVELASTVRAAQPAWPAPLACRLDWTAGWALKACGRVDEAALALASAIVHAQAAGDRYCEGHALSLLGELHVNAGRIDEGRLAQTRSHEMALAEGDAALEAQSLTALGNLHWRLGELDDTLRCHAAALDAARRAGDRRWEGGALGNLGLVHIDLGRAAEALVCCTQALQIARELGDRQWEGNTLSNLGLLHQLQHRHAEATAALEAALRCAREIGHVRLEGVVRLNLGIAVEAGGRPAEALGHFEAALQVARSLGDRRSEGQALGYLGGLHGRQGRHDAALGCLRDGQALLEQSADRLSLALVRCTQAECRHRAGDAEAARAALHAARALATEIGVEPDSELGRSLTQVEELLGEAEPAL